MTDEYLLPSDASSSLPPPTAEDTMRFLQSSSLHQEVCQSLDVVDACRGTGVGNLYNRNYHPYNGTCTGSFVPGMPIYVFEGGAGNIYIYAVGVYPNDWSVTALRGLTHWTIASFQAQTDKTTCRTDQANVFQVDFAALGEAYNFYPTINCFDYNGPETSGYQSSTINIRCNDYVVSAQPNTNTGTTNNTGGGGGKKGGLGTGGTIAIVAVVLLLLIGAGYWYWRKQQAANFDYGEDDIEKGEEIKKKDKKKDKKKRKKDKKDKSKDKKTKSKPPSVVPTEIFQDPEEPQPEFTPEEISEEMKQPIPISPRSEKKVFGLQREKSQRDPSEHNSLTRAPSVKQTRRMSTDPPAINSPVPKDVGDDDDDEAIPADIKTMVSRLNNFFDADDDKGKTSKFPRMPSVTKMPSWANRSGHDPKVPRDPSAHNEKRTTPRTRSLSPSPANQFDKTTTKATRTRSLSPSAANDFSKKNRSNSLEAAKYSPVQKNRSKSIERNPEPKELSRKSLERNPSLKKVSQERSRSLERGTPDVKQGRGRSLEPASPTKGRGKSLERATPDVKKVRGRSAERGTPDVKSLDPFFEEKSPKVTRRPSLQEVPDVKKLLRAFEQNSKAAPKPESTPKPPAPSQKASPKPPATKPIGRGSKLDASAPEIVFNPDGSVTVIVKKIREDGATVRQKTTYSDRKMAAKYGYAV